MISEVLPIDKFIEHVLYDKKKGYYSKKNPFGKQGDFITSPGISFLFSEMIAVWIISYWENLKKPKNLNVVELGPGDGALCKTLIRTFKNFPNFYKSVNIFLYEKSETLKKIQKKNIRDKKIRWLKNINDIKDGPVLFFGNEFFDAIPIKQFKKNNEKVFEKYLSLRKGSNIEVIFKKAPKNIIKELKKFNLLNGNGIIEYPKQGLRELDKITRIIKKYSGGILLIDYGFEGTRKIDTLQSVMRHKKNKLFSNIGEADITSLVNFTILKKYFLRKKFNTSNVVSQSFFLKRIGIVQRAEILSKKTDFRAKTDLYLRLKRLLDEKYMGSLFKVIFAQKNKRKFLLGLN